jgi:hypothetical protein
MARTNQTVRNLKGQYVKLTILNKVKYFCNYFMTKIDKWAKSVEK